MFRTEINQTHLTRLSDQITVFVNSVFRLQPPFFFGKEDKTKQLHISLQNEAKCRYHQSRNVL